MDELEQIRNRLTIEDVVGPYVQLKKTGRSYKALCPFHQEKTPSFVISPDKGLAYCFGCRKGGDIFAFTQEIENVEFPEAVKILAEKAGIELKTNSMSPKNKEQKDQLLNLLQQAHQFFKQQLSKNSLALKYLESRHYDAEICKKLELGFAPDGFHELSSFLQAQGFSNKEMLDAGVVSQKEIGDSNVYDRFRNRIIFPIHTPQGKLVAFGGRTLSKDPQAAKYLNSPETKTYHKGQTLYYFHQAKQAIRDQDLAIITEGYFDTLTAHIHGYYNTVASLGTALTEDQIKLIGRFSKKLAFAFDADQSGQNAASRSIEIAQRLGFQVRLIHIPSGKDPDDAIRSDSQEWEKAIKNAVNATEYEFQKAFQNTDASSLEGKKTIVRELLPIINRLPNAIEREHYLKKLSLDLETSLKSLLIELQKLPNVPKSSIENPFKQDPEHSKIDTRQSYSKGEYLCGLLINHPEHLEEVKTAIKPDYFRSEQEKKLYNSVLALYNQAEQKKKEEKMNQKQEEPPDKGRLQLLELYAAEQTQAFVEDQEFSAEITALCSSIRSEYKRRRLKELSIQLTKLDSAESPNKLIEEHQQLLEDHF